MVILLFNSARLILLLILLPAIPNFLVAIIDYHINFEVLSSESIQLLSTQPPLPFKVAGSLIAIVIALLIGISFSRANRSQFSFAICTVIALNCVPSHGYWLFANQGSFQTWRNISEVLRHYYLVFNLELVNYNHDVTFSAPIQLGGDLNLELAWFELPLVAGGGWIIYLALLLNLLWMVFILWIVFNKLIPAYARNYREPNDPEDSAVTSDQAINT